MALPAPQLRLAEGGIYEIEKNKLNQMVSGLPESSKDGEDIIICVNSTQIKSTATQCLIHSMSWCTSSRPRCGTVGVEVELKLG